MRNSLSHDVPDAESMCKYSDIRFSTTKGIVTCEYCGFISDNVPELLLHKADANDGLIFRCNQCEVTDIEKDDQLNHVRKAHEDKGFPYKLCECDTETGPLQEHFKIKHTDDPLDESKTTETHTEVKIEVKREHLDPGDSSPTPEKVNKTLQEGRKIRPAKHKMQVKREIMNSDDSSLPPVKGNETVPEGWKIRPDKNKKQEHLTDKSKPILEAKIEI